MGWTGSKSEGLIRAGKRATSVLAQGIPVRWDG